LIKILTVHRKVLISNAPKEFSLYVVPILERLGTTCFFTERPDIVRHIREVFGFCIKILISVIAIILSLTKNNKVLFYTLKPVDPELRCDRRFINIYDELLSQKIPFMEIVFSKANADAVRELQMRKRLSLYYRQLISLFSWLFPRISMPAIKVNSITAIERAILDEYWEYTVRRLRMTQILRVLLKILRPRVLLILDDSREMFPLVSAAKSCKIPVISYQHGPIYPRVHPGLICYGNSSDYLNHAPDKYFVWSEYVKKRLMQRSRLFKPEQVVVGGQIRRLPRKLKRDHSCAAVIRVLWIGEPLSDLNHIKPFISAIAKCKDFELRYRPRPDNIDMKHQIIIKQWDFPVQFSNAKSINDDLRYTDVVIGTYCSVLYECYLQLLPSVVIKSISNFAQDIAEEEWAIVASSPDEVVSKIKEAAFSLGEEDLLYRQHLIWGNGDMCGYKLIVEECKRFIT
jgi:hypothetical protein